MRARRSGLPAFRRQHPFGPYILDFYCARLGLAVEIDGLIHGMGNAPAHDTRRDAWLRSQGVEILRYPAADVLAEADEVAGSIWTLVLSRIR
ncbi:MULTISPECIES: endonuclease domain-containing protein [unclassified Brevundimonas]|uniref:endonuclease domain-containing protein n=1 Tax=unclassified Brevundimonas TaxID=2622653 RepID=UPI003F8FCFDA